MNKTYLEHLPNELFHEIFSYLWCNEIFRSFYDLNQRITDIITTYNSYFLNFSLENIGKREYDLICLFIQPKQIIGLKLGENFFDLFDQYFASKNYLKTFTHLRSLWISERIHSRNIYPKLFEFKIPFHQLLTFRYDSELFYTHIPSLNHLSSLFGCSSNQYRRFSKTISKHLIRLHIFLDSLNDFNNFIGINSNQLISLGIGIRCDSNNINSFTSLFSSYQWTKLIHFHLNLQTISSTSISCSLQTIKQILFPMFKLKFLTLKFNEYISIDHYLSNANKWKLFLSRILFNLKTYFIDFYSNGHKLIKTKNYSSKLELIQWNLTELNNIEKFIDDNDIDLSNVKYLSLKGNLTNIIANQIPMIINFELIQHLQISSIIDNNQNFLQLIIHMTNLLSLNIHWIDLLYLFPLVSLPLKSIEKLILIGDKITKKKIYFAHICYIFPHLTHLTTEYPSRQIIRYLLHRLLYLEQINLHLTYQDYPPNFHWIKKHTRLNNHLFQSEIFNIHNQERVFIIWINVEPIINDNSKINRCQIQ